MKFVEVGLYQLDADEVRMLLDGTPVLVYDTVARKNKYKIIQASNVVDELLDPDRYVLLLLNLHISKNKGEKIIEP